MITKPDPLGTLKDSTTGLSYMQARYYDQVTGRFLSIDPVTFMDNENPSFFNRYAYAFNDPVNLTDPTGMAPDDENIPQQENPNTSQEALQTTVSAVGVGMQSLATVTPEKAVSSIKSITQDAKALAKAGTALSVTAKTMAVANSDTLGAEAVAQGTELLAGTGATALVVETGPAAPVIGAVTDSVVTDMVRSTLTTPPTNPGNMRPVTPVTNKPSLGQNIAATLRNINCRCTGENM